MQYYFEEIKSFINELNIGSILIILFIIFSFYKKLKIRKNEITNNDIYYYVEQNLYQNNFSRIIQKIIAPNKGDIVHILDGRWKHLTGRITKYDSIHDTYNIKLTKTLNPYDNDLPKKKINRNRDKFSLIKY